MVTTAQPAATTAQPAASPITSDQAGTIALASAPGATLTGAPILVSYQGAAVYEVTLDSGLVYVDAGNGAVVANMATNAPTSSGQGGDDQDNDD